MDLKSKILAWLVSRTLFTVYVQMAGAVTLVVHVDCCIAVVEEVLSVRLVCHQPMLW